MSVEEYDFDEIEEFLSEQEELPEVHFGELLGEIMENGFSDFPKKFLPEMLSLVLFEFRDNRKILLTVMALALTSAMFVNLASAFESSQVSQTSVLLARLVNVVLLMGAFSGIITVISSYMEKLIDFMNSILPVYIFSVTFSTGTVSAQAMRQTAMIAMWLVEYCILKLLLPAVRLYVVMELVNTVTGDNSFQKMCALVQKAVIWANNTLLAFVAGLNIIKGMVSPYADKTAAMAFNKAASLIPGIGNSISGLTDLVIGTGKFISNSIGVAGLIVIILISAQPVIKMAVFSLMYRFCGALLEPVADKKIIEGISGVGEGVALLLRLSFTGALMFMLTIGMVCM
jgi:stage III sporulation protein AE